MENKVETIIQQTVPDMIQDAIETHSHNGGDSQKLLGASIVGAPQPALTTASVGSLSSGGSAVLSNADSAILTNALLRLAELESRLQTLQLLN